MARALVTMPKTAKRGEVIEIRSTPWVYDSHGRVLSEISETDYLVDGTVPQNGLSC